MRQAWILDGVDLVPAEEYHRRAADRASRCRTGSPMVLTDWRPDEAVVSPVDGSMLTSRADVREHNRRNGVIDVGSDPAAAPGRMPARPSGSAARKEVIAGVARGEIPVAPAAATLNPGEW